MTLSNWITGLLMAGALTFAGCGKSDKPVTADDSVQAIDTSSLRPAFLYASPEIKAIVGNVTMSIQSSAYKDAVAGLDKLAGLPNLNEEQKKAVADLTEQVKKKMASLSP